MEQQNNKSECAATMVAVGMKYVWYIFIVGLSVHMAANYSLWWLLLLFLII